MLLTCYIYIYNTRFRRRRRRRRRIKKSYYPLLPVRFMSHVPIVLPSHAHHTRTRTHTTHIHTQGFIKFCLFPLYMSASIHAYIHERTHTHTRIHTHAYTHTHIYIYIRLPHMCFYLSLPLSFLKWLVRTFLTSGQIVF